MYYFKLFDQKKKKKKEEDKAYEAGEFTRQMRTLWIVPLVRCYHTTKMKIKRSVHSLETFVTLLCLLRHDYAFR